MLSQRLLEALMSSLVSVEMFCMTSNVGVHHDPVTVTCPAVQMAHYF